jgi:hypothetical protein
MEVSLMLRRFSGLRWLASLALLCLSAALSTPLEAESYLGKAVTVYRKGLPALTGTVIEEMEGKQITLQIRNGQLVIAQGDITRVEVKKPPAEEFQDRSRLARTADDWVKLARWCGQPEVKLPEERKRCLEAAIKVDPQNAEARKELGQVKDQKGQWVDEDEYYAGKGMEKVEGKWVSAEEAAKLRAEKFTKGATARERETTGVAWATAKLVKTAHYVLKCNSTEGVAKRYSLVLEQLYKAYSEVLKGYEALYTGLGTVYVFRSQDEFMDFTLQNRYIGGFFSPVDRSVRAFHGSFGLTGNTDMVLAHEATHQFQHRIMREMQAVPYWLIEGMAVYFGDGTQITPDHVQLHVIPRDRLQTLQEAIRGGHYVPLSKLLMIRQGMNTMPCYDHGWGVIFWCLQGNNPKYKFGHKGEGKRIWDRYLQHVTREIKRPLPANHMEQEAKYFTDLILKETGSASIEKWEESYKKFIMALSLEPMGKWKGKSWEGVGIRFTAPERFIKVEEKDLRASFREAAAALTEDGVRLWLVVDFNGGIEPSDHLRGWAAGHFVDREPEPDFKDEEVKEITVNVFKVPVTAFKGKQARRSESKLNLGTDPKEPKGAEKPGKKAAGTRPEAKGAEPVELRVRLALFATPDRVYVIGMSGPEAPFSKQEPKFEEVLNSVRFDLSGKK